MTRLFYFAIIVLLVCSCSKDQVIPKNTAICGTPGWPQGNWNIKYEIVGTTIPDSVHLTVNMPNPSTSYYFIRSILPNLPLKDSTNFCGDINSDVNIFLYDDDTSRIYTCKIYVNNVLKTNVTGKSTSSPYWLHASTQCK